MKKLLKFFNYISRIGVFVFVILLLNMSASSLSVQEITNTSSNRVVSLAMMAKMLENDAKHDLYSAKDVLEGDLTGYAANCPLCGGHLACKPTYDVLNGVNTYVDSDYGEVYIVASSLGLPCGSIVRFNLPKMSSEPMLAIVLDRGVLGNDLDLLMPTEEMALRSVGRVRVSYDILRKGWTID